MSNLQKALDRLMARTLGAITGHDLTHLTHAQLAEVAAAFDAKEAELDRRGVPDGGDASRAELTACVAEALAKLETQKGE